MATMNKRVTKKRKHSPYQCADCKEIKADVSLVNCPFQEDVYDRQIPVYLCDACFHERVMDI